MGMKMWQNWRSTNLQNQNLTHGSTSRIKFESAFDLVFQIRIWFEPSNPNPTLISTFELKPNFDFDLIFQIWIRYRPSNSTRTLTLNSSHRPAFSSFDFVFCTSFSPSSSSTRYDFPSSSSSFLVFLLFSWRCNLTQKGFFLLGMGS